MTLVEPRTAAPPHGDDTAHPRWVDRFVVHLGLYGLLLVGLLAVTPTLDPWTSDDGSYAHATRLLADGTWSEARGELDLAEDPSRYALALSDVDSGGRAYPYIKHPAWIAVQRVAVGVAGERVGLVLPNLVGGALAAAAAWAASRRIGLVHPSVAFWIVGLGPMAVTSTSLWSHGLAAGAGGAVALLVVRLVDGRSWSSAVGLGAALGVVVVTRTEGTLLIPAAVAGLVVARPGGWRDVRRLIDPAVAGVAAAVILVAERAWIGSLVDAAPLRPTGPDPGPSVGLLLGRTLAAWRTFTLGANGDIPGELLTLALIGCSVVAVVVIARQGDGRFAALLLVAGIGLGAVRWAGHIHGQDSLVSGIVPAWPVMAAGVFLWACVGRNAPRAERALAVLTGVFTLFLLAVQYEGGAGTDWGGRYLAPIAVPLGVLAAAGLARAGAAARSVVGDGDVDPARPPTGGLRLLPLVVVAGLVLTAFGTVVTLTMRSDAAAVVARARASDADVVISLPAFVPRTDLAADATTFWRRPGEEDPAAAVARAFAEGHRRVGVLGAEADQVEVPGVERRVVVPGELVVFGLG